MTPNASRSGKNVSKEPHTILLGLGNPILTDDGAGIYVVREMHQLIDLSKHRGIAIQESSLGGLGFIDLLTGYRRAVIVDAIHTKSGKPGEFYELDPKALKPSARLSSLHGIDFATACELGRKLEIEFPEEFAIFVMEVADEFTFSEQPTPAVSAAIPEMAKEIMSLLKSRGWI